MQESHGECQLNSEDHGINEQRLPKMGWAD